MLTTVELTIRRLPNGSRNGDARLTSDVSAAATQLAANVPVALDAAALLAVEHDPAAYGALLAAQLFADPRLRHAWLKARAFAATGDLQLRLNLDAGDAMLHALRWETLRDPETDQPIALHERVRLVRTLDSPDLTPVVIPPRPELRALVIVANPSNLGTFQLAEVDVDGEVARARAALGDIPTTILGDSPDRRATLANIMAALRDEPQIVILVAHGTIPEGTSLLWLEREDGRTDTVTGSTFVEAIQRLSARPLLLVLASCRSAGSGYGDTLSALGPRLAGAGVPAVLAFQGNVAMSTVKTLLPTLITELRRDGQIDRALAAARGALGEQRPWWQAVLWLRTDGRLWEEREVPIPTLPGRGNLAYDQLSLEAYAIAFLCTAGGIVLGISMPFAWGWLSGGLLGILIGYLFAVTYIGKTRENRRRYAFYITRMAFPHLFEERIQVVLARQWYVAPADLDDLKYTYNLDDDHLTYPMADYAEKHPVEVQYAYLYNKCTRLPIAYKRGMRDKPLTPVKVLIDATQAVPDEYIVTSYPLLLQ